MIKQIRTILVDDEQKSILTLRKLLEKYCPQVYIEGVAHNVCDAIKLIDEKNPELVFLDISMPDGEGFEVIEKVQCRTFEVIFTTAHNQYAVKAFEMSALHYLLKPIDDIELQNAIERYEKLTAPLLGIDEKIEVLKDVIGNVPERLILPTLEGFSIVNIKEIIRCEADNNYTLFCLTNSRELVVSKTLSTFEKILDDLSFCRIHHKHLVNLRHVKQYVKGRGGYIMLEDGTYLNVSEAKKTEFLNKMKNIARSF